MKRRVGVAQAILGAPRLLIVDEPSVGRDPEERVRLRSLLSELAARCTVILSTHIVEDISQSCNALAVIDRGQALFHGPPGELIARAAGRVWIVESDGAPPEGEVTVVSSVQISHATHYRAVGTPAPGPRATPAEPRGRLPVADAPE